MRMPDLVRKSDRAPLFAAVEKSQMDKVPGSEQAAELKPGTLFERLCKRLSLTPAQTETLAGVKFPCC